MATGNNLARDSEQEIDDSVAILLVDRLACICRRFRHLKTKACIDEALRSKVSFCIKRFRETVTPPKGKGPSLIQRHKLQTAVAAALEITDGAGMQPIGRRLSPAHTGL